MAVYTFAQLEELWIQAGGSRALAPLMAGVAEVESGGNPNAYNASGASGLWQIEIPLHSGLVPGGGANVFNPADNAKAAVTLSGNTIAGIRANWLAFEPAGAAEAIAKQHGGTTPSSAGAPAAATSPSATSSASAAQLTSFTPGDLIDPFQGIQAAVQAAAGSITSLISGPADIATSVTRLAKDFNTLVGLFNAILADIEWLFVPSHWVRIFCGLFGVGALIPGVWALMKTGSGQQGDITMAIGILLVTVAGVLLFLAFHNLPTDITDLGGLLGYITAGIAAGKAPVSGSLFSPDAGSQVQHAAEGAVT